MEFDKKISAFISDAPLYKKMEVDEIFTSPYNFQDFGIKVFCSNENDFTTHLMSIHPKETLKYIGELPVDTYTKISAHHKPEQFSFTQQYKAICQSCREHEFDVVLDVRNFKINDDTNNAEITKIGQYPAFTIRPEKTVIKYLDNESNDFYKKALLNLSHGYGIGAYSYLRRITETLLIKFLNDISKLDYSESKQVKDLLKQHEQNHDMSSLVDSVFQFLPDSLKALGNNPFRYLYGELSIGLHKLSENECVEKAEKLSKVLTFVIKKVVEEQTEITEIRKLMK